MGLIDDYKNKIQYAKQCDDEDYFELKIEVEGVLTDDRYNELEYELNEVLKKFKVYYSGV